MSSAIEDVEAGLTEETLPDKNSIRLVRSSSQRRSDHNQSRLSRMAGDYGGAEASATLGVGAGANVLVGGSHRSFVLQPISIEGQTGLSLAAGVESLKVR